jgi:hypothetical protein
MMKAVHNPETLVYSNKAILCYIPESSSAQKIICKTSLTNTLSKIKMLTAPDVDFPCLDFKQMPFHY